MNVVEDASLRAHFKICSVVNKQHEENVSLGTI